MKKLIIITMILAFTLISCVNPTSVLAMEVEQSYVIYDTEGNYLFERIDVVVGDEYIDKEFNSYEVISIDEKSHTGVAKFVKKYTPKKSLKIIKPVNEIKTIGLYMSHNDESYVSGDGYDSIYGAGGIHDIAKQIKSHLEEQNVNVTLDETLHIPHDTNAYVRSSVTATKIINNISPDAIFDIHRDGTSRGFYITEVDGKERCMVRIVIGKSNPNMSVNREFALNLMNTANEICPWLFVDLYVGQGHYNQALHNRAVLFEMGSHLVEKDLVMETTQNLADVIYRTLYGDETIETPTLPEDGIGGLGDANQNIGDTNTSDGVQQGGDNTGSGITNDVGEDDDNSVNDNNIGNNTTNDNSEDSTSDSKNEQDEDKKDDNQNDGLNVIIVISVIGVLAIVAYFIWRASKIREI